MSIAKSITTRMVPTVLAIGLTVAGNFTPAWGSESVAAPQAEPATAPAKEQVPLVDDRMLAIGLGVLGGVATYSLLAGSWGGGMGAARMARVGVPGAAIRWGGAWGGRWLFVTASGVIGAFVGDWIHRSNESAAK